MRDDLGPPSPAEPTRLHFCIAAWPSNVPASNNHAQHTGLHNLEKQTPARDGVAGWGPGLVGGPPPGRAPSRWWRGRPSWSAARSRPSWPGRSRGTLAPPPTQSKLPVAPAKQHASFLVGGGTKNKQKVKCGETQQMLMKKAANQKA